MSLQYSSEFNRYLEKEKRCSYATQKAYGADAEEFSEFLRARGKSDKDAGKADIAAYLMEIEEKKSASTVGRRLASIRCYYTFLKSRGKISENPTEDIKSPRQRRETPEFLSVSEMEKVLALPKDDDKGIRDRALLELMYATGIRAGEASLADAADVNLQIGFISIRGERGSVRMIPIGRPARRALEDYLSGARKRLIGQGGTEALFVNFTGARISRQGIWKILKAYGKEAELSSGLSPKLIRNTFAAHMVQNGADLKSLQEIMGHEDIAATKIFLNLNKKRIMEVYDKAFPRA